MQDSYQELETKEYGFGAWVLLIVMAIYALFHWTAVEIIWRRRFQIAIGACTLTVLWFMFWNARRAFALH